MPRVIDYPSLLQQMQSQGLRSLYHNSGAFGFPRAANVLYAGWIGPPDDTIRPEARKLIQQIDEPYVPNLVNRLIRLWQSHLKGAIWFAPMSHWSFELDHGSKVWMPQLLRDIHIDPAPLTHLNTAPAIEFAQTENDLVRAFATGLLENLRGSDFAILFPDRQVIGNLHHHQQFWWTTTDAAFHALAQGNP
ncbi:MAG TPA: hypothetical protein VL282_14550 [Tepidisphaeraceae bacterium]|jgi:hypothetical protein|nr:hypothetical protein [Tepidisphaeraceae bacterium]